MGILCRLLLIATLLILPACERKHSSELQGGSTEWCLAIAQENLKSAKTRLPKAQTDAERAEIQREIAFEKANVVEQKRIMKCEKDGWSDCSMTMCRSA